MALAKLLRGLFQGDDVRPVSPGSYAEVARLFEERLATWPTAPEPTGRCVGVLLTPWVKTATPFFALECALALRATGCRVRIYWDPTDLLGNAGDAGEIATVQRIVDALPEDLDVVDVAALPALAEGPDHELASAIVEDNAIWRMRGEGGAPRFREEHPDALRAVRAHVAGVLALFTRAPVDRLLISGGIYGVSAAYLAAAQRQRVPFTVFDSGPGLLLLSHSGIAAHHGDTAVAVERLLEEGDRRSINHALAEGERELHRRMTGQDEHAYQLAPATGAAAGGAELFVPLNLRWDAAALSRLRLFDSVEHWLTQLLEWTARRPEVRICIRQHPVERHERTRSRDDLPALFARHSALGDRLRFVAADEPVNSYDLMRAARVVLPFTSSAGLEAAMLGIPVVLGTRSYYEALPFVCRAETIGEYFAFIEQGLAGNVPVSEAGRRAATLAYYFTQRCAYLRTPFTPTAEDFQRWVAIPPLELWSRPEQHDLQEVLLTSLPLPLVQHRRFLERSAAAAEVTGGFRASVP